MSVVFIQDVSIACFKKRRNLIPYVFTWIFYIKYEKESTLYISIKEVTLFTFC